MFLFIGKAIECFRNNAAAAGTVHVDSALLCKQTYCLS
jgi:hypothetical protein